MDKAWVPISTYAAMVEQAAKNNGRIVLEAIGTPPFEVVMDPEYAKKEWAEFEETLKKFNKIPN